MTITSVSRFLDVVEVGAEEVAEEVQLLKVMMLVEAEVLDSLILAAKAGIASFREVMVAVIYLLHFPLCSECFALPLLTVVYEAFFFVRRPSGR